MLKEIIISIQAYFKAHKFIKQHKLWKWILIPGIIYAVLFIFSMYFFFGATNAFVNSIVAKTGFGKCLSNQNDGWLSVLFILATMFLSIVEFLVSLSLFKYFFLIIGSPIFAYLSEKTEAIVAGQEYSFSFIQLFTDIIRGIKIAARSAVWQTVYMISILLISFTPLALITPLIALLVECYYYGFSMLDYSMERNKKTAAESIFFINHHKGLAIGNGIVFYLMHLLPIVGWLLAPAYSVIAATLSLHDVKQDPKAITQQ